MLTYLVLTLRSQDVPRNGVKFESKIECDVGKECKASPAQRCDLRVSALDGHTPLPPLNGPPAALISSSRFNSLHTYLNFNLKFGQTVIRLVDGQK